MVNPSTEPPKSADSSQLHIHSIESTLKSHPEFDNHEQVVRCDDPVSGLRALIAVHSTRLGPSLGGCRMWHYEKDADAVTDVLRLSRAMSFKHAIAGTGRGGGKAVILTDVSHHKSPELLWAFGRFVESLNGSYITAEDVGMCVDDMLYVHQNTQHVAGLPIEAGGSGDPSPMTAHGVFWGIAAALAWTESRETFSGFDPQIVQGKTVAVQGLGHVGIDLCRQLHGAGAKLLVTDIDQSRVETACRELNAQAVATGEILQAEADVLAPCALGGVLDAKTIEQLRVRIVAGAANNQLATPNDGDLLHRRGILYAPDYVITAGGIINIANERPRYDAVRAKQQTQRIAETVWQIFQQSQKVNLPPSVVAEQLARERLVAS